jgi:two-component system, NarL family, sensor histidine kinase LiaS
MKKWLDRRPAFMRRLWCQLAISFTLLTFCAILLLIVMLYGADDYSDFHKTYTLDNVLKRVASEQFTVAQAIRDTDNTEWLDIARGNIREKLTNMEPGRDAANYRITNSSRPEVYIHITDSNGHLLLSDPSPFPEKIATQFSTHEQPLSEQSSVKRLAENGPIWVDIPITNHDGGTIGRLRVLYIAEFNFWVQLQSVFDFLLYRWRYVFYLSVPIGIASGLLASRYVTNQLQKMNEVTENWRQGNFEARIALPSDDVLVRHSQHLNDMAQDLEMYLSLKQNMAVSDERNRVARELHDTVKQKLFALGLQLATAKAKPAMMDSAQEHILEAEAINREAQHDLMEIITQLRPTETSDFSLHERISTIADDFQRRFDVNIELNHLETVQCNAHTEHHLLRIVQEALLNAVRHGKASRIVIASSADQGTAKLTITDNGSGFDPDKKVDGFGLVSMRDRAHDLPHGAFEIRSTAGLGTQITLSWKNEL